MDYSNYLKIKGSYHFPFLRKRESRSILQQRSYIGEVAIPPSRTHSFSNFCWVSSHYPPSRTHNFLNQKENYKRNQVSMELSSSFHGNFKNYLMISRTH
uniref:Uncharacterized protein n=1 Tax=Manihot esculenta TaxID=3983 RepID=A0A2C9UXS4_MANES